MGRLALGMREELGPPDGAIARVAGEQHGIVTTAQIEAIGIDKSGIERRLRAGRLHRVHRGVYAVGHRVISDEGHWMAAVLACGDGAALSHESAVVLWGLLRPIDGPVHVSVRSRSGRTPGEGIRLHRPRSFAPSDLTRRSGIPVTTPNRTLLDLQRSRFDHFLLRHAIREAEHRKYKLDPRLRGDRTRSDLERDFLAFCRRHRIPPPQVNLRVGWPHRRFRLARPPARGRNRQLPAPPGLDLLRGRPRPRPEAASPRPHSAPLHRPPARGGSRAGRRRGRGPSRLPQRRHREP